ncbi:MAG TPA: N-acetylglutaminylglutamine amidotransferase [Solirubrobacteraceae bacterium]
MCGIAGEIRFTGGADVAAVERMAAVLAPRGPDGSGTHAADGVALAHRRLKIIDLSPSGSQPMVDAQLGLTIVFNGCIYNYRELRAELEADGYRFFSRSDTEVLLKAYDRWGEDFVDHLHGMFAIAIAERDTGDVILVRDRLGIKPLYTAEIAGGIRFASTLPALVAGGGIDTSIDRIALHHYLTFHSVVPAPRTILNGVRRVHPGTLVRISASGRLRETRYWQAAFRRKPADDGMESADWAEAVLEALRVAVDRRMVADVPVGVLLSGGLDSSLIVALLAESGQPRLSTFSVGFERVGGHDGDEFEFSDLVAREFATDHHRFVVSGDRLLPALDRAIGAMSEPMVSHDVVAFHLLSEEVSKHVTVVQSGQGADEIFAGYDWYPPLRDARGDGFDEYSGRFFDRSHAEITEALEPDFRADRDASREFVRGYFDRLGADTPTDRALRLDTEVMLVDDPVKRVDNMTMAWGLEGRVPFLDHELVELAAACPSGLKLAHGGKGVLKDAARRVLPSAVIDREKGYFPVPALIHLDGPFLELVESALRSPQARARGLFRPEYVDRLLAAPNDERTPLGGNKLWQLGVLELWLQAQGL